MSFLVRENLIKKVDFNIFVVSVAMKILDSRVSVRSECQEL